MRDPADISTRWEQTWERIHAEAHWYKDPTEIVLLLQKRYAALHPEERPIVDQLLAKTLGSDDENARFDALAMIRKFRIRSALPALRDLAIRLEEDTSPMALSEWGKVNTIIGCLVEGLDQDEHTVDQ